ncbi:MAG TPA: recombinase family protein [Falsiroseomonas sp.]|jgi:DNA invertase Pin-like site-specific DNA recombinase|nr:recombinase family protein [Falsiroseomonas sp.]
MTTSTTAGRAFVAYCRVSTDRQGRSGLGLEAQRAAIDAFLKPTDRLLAPAYVEVESGRSSTRPELQRALQRCQETGATLLVAKLDRLSRSVPFLRSLIDGSVDVAFCDMPQLAPGAMGRFILTQMAAVAELEAGLISERTRAALKAAKARGVKLGGDRGYRGGTPPDASQAAAAASLARATRAMRFRASVAPTVRALREQGLSYRGIAIRLDQDGVPSPSGRGWNHMAVMAVLGAAT